MALSFRLLALNSEKMALKFTKAGAIGSTEVLTIQTSAFWLRKKEIDELLMSMIEEKQEKNKNESNPNGTADNDDSEEGNLKVIIIPHS